MRTESLRISWFKNEHSYFTLLQAVTGCLPCRPTGGAVQTQLTRQMNLTSIKLNKEAIDYILSDEREARHVYTS